MISNKQRRWAYRQWLGLPESVSEPTIYQTIGVSPFEDDPTVIRNAIEQRRAFINSKRDGSHDQIIDAILSELDDSAAIIFAPELRHQYDQAKGIRRRPVNPRSRAANAGRSRFLWLFGLHRNERDMVDGNGFLSTFAGIMAIILACIFLMILAAWYFPAGKLVAKSVSDDPATVERADQAADSRESMLDDSWNDASTTDSIVDQELPSEPPIESIVSSSTMPTPEITSTSETQNPPIKMPVDDTAVVPQSAATTTVSQKPIQKNPEISRSISFTGLGSRASCLRIGASNDWLLAGGQNGNVALWDIKGKGIWKVKLPPLKTSFRGDNSVLDLEVDLDGETIIVASRTGLHFLRLRDGQPLREGVPFANRTASARLSSDARYALTSNGDGRVAVTNVKTGREFRSENAYVPSVACDRKDLVFVGHNEGEKQNRLLKFRTWEKVQDITGLSNRVHFATFSDDNQMIAGCSGTDYNDKSKSVRGGVCVWRRSGSGKYERSGEWTTDRWQWSAAFSQDNRYLLTGGGGSDESWSGGQPRDRPYNCLTVWDHQSARALKSLGNFRGSINQVKVASNNAFLVLASMDQSIQAWPMVEVLP